MGRKERGLYPGPSIVISGIGRCSGRKARVDDRQAPYEEAEGGRHDSDPTQLATAGARADPDEAGTATAIPRMNLQREKEASCACRRRPAVLRIAHLLLHLMMPSPS